MMTVITAAYKGPRRKMMRIKKKWRSRNKIKYWKSKKGKQIFTSTSTVGLFTNEHSNKRKKKEQKSGFPANGRERLQQLCGGWKEKVKMKQKQTVFSMRGSVSRRQLHQTQHFLFEMQQVAAKMGIWPTRSGFFLCPCMPESSWNAPKRFFFWPNGCRNSSRRNRNRKWRPFHRILAAAGVALLRLAWVHFRKKN